MGQHMAIGRYRVDPEDMTAAEREVVAAQYPEGALVAGMGLGMAVTVVLASSLVFAGGIVGGLVGYVVGRWFRARRLGQLPEEPDSVSG